MSQILRKLRIDEVSSIDRAANTGARVVIMKRAETMGHENEIYTPEAIRKAAIIAEQAPEKFNAAQWHDIFKSLVTHERDLKTESFDKAYLRVATVHEQGRKIWKAMRSAEGDPGAVITKRQDPRAIVKADSAYAELQRLAEVHRKEHPKKTKDQAFAAVYADPKNRELADRSKTEKSIVLA